MWIRFSPVSSELLTSFNLTRKTKGWPKNVWLQICSDFQYSGDHNSHLSFRLSLRKGLCLSLDPFVRNNKQLFNTNWNIEIKKDCLQQSKFKFFLKFKTQKSKHKISCLQSDSEWLLTKRRALASARATETFGNVCFFWNMDPAEWCHGDPQERVFKLVRCYNTW